MNLTKCFQKTECRLKGTVRLIYGFFRIRSGRTWLVNVHEPIRERAHGSEKTQNGLYVKLVLSNIQPFPVLIMNYELLWTKKEIWPNCCSANENNRRGRNWTQRFRNGASNPFFHRFSQVLIVRSYKWNTYLQFNRISTNNTMFLGVADMSIFWINNVESGLFNLYSPEQFTRVDTDT
jgi:hypothetical protein